METQPSQAEQLVAHYRSLADSGLMELSAGNLSCRQQAGMLISRSGVSAASMDADALVFCSLQGEYQGEHKPSSEWRMHAALYAERPDVSAVVHTHSDYCVALACQGRGLPGFHYMVGMLGASEIPCVAYATFGTQALAEAAARALHGVNACLLANHGMLSVGASVEEAANNARLLEMLCRQYLLSCELGEPRSLSDAQWQEFFQQMNQTGYQAVKTTRV